MFEVSLVHRWMAGRIGCTLLPPRVFYSDLLAFRQWQALIATVSYTAAGVLLSMVTIYHPSYQQQNWQQYLVMVAIGMFATLMNTYGAKKLPMLEYIMLVVQLVGFVCISGPFLRPRPQRAKCSPLSRISADGLISGQPASSDRSLQRLRLQGPMLLYTWPKRWRMPAEQCPG
jgi:hypothetical protein